VTVPRTSPSRTALTVDAGRLWAGGAATAVVAGLVALVGVLIADDVLDLVMVEPPLLPIGDALAVRYAVTAAALALVATGLAHLLVLSTPHPVSFFRWIVGLVTVVGVVLPFTVDGTTGGRLATAAVNLVIGLAVMSLLAGVMRRTVRPVAAPRPGYPAP